MEEEREKEFLTILKEIFSVRGIFVDVYKEPYREIRQLENRMSLYDRLFGDYGMDMIMAYWDQTFEKNVIYLYTSPLMVKCLIFFPVKDEKHPEGRVLMAGPYLTERREKLLDQMEEKFQATLYDMNYLKHYYADIPMYDDRYLGHDMKIFLQRIFHVEIEDIREIAFEEAKGGKMPALRDRENAWENEVQLQKTYELEDELMRCIASGDEQSSYRIVQRINFGVGEDRTKRGIQKQKTSLISLHTLCRKGAQRAKVPAGYLGELWEECNKRIEQIVFSSEASDMFGEIIRRYCLLVRNHTMRQYSGIVRRTMIYIERNLREDLSRERLAETIGANPGYLSTRFKAETGKTLGAFITEKRLQQALVYLGTTEWPIQEVAARVGILDVSYFSRLFRENQGMTPSAYRACLQKEKKEN